MLENGYIKLHRSLLKWEWYDDVNTKVLFLHLLLTANYEDNRWQGIDVPRGSTITSYGKLSIETGLSIQNVRTGIKRLISTGEITHVSTSKFGLFTVINYEKYQGGDDEVTHSQQSANSQPTVSQQQRKKANKANKEKNKETPIPPPPKPDDTATQIPAEIAEAWQAYAEMRKAKKKPLTDKAVTLAIGKLEKLAPGNYRKQSAILNQSTFNSWVGLFELKDGDYDEQPERMEFVPPKPEDDAPFRRSLPDGASLLDWLPPATERMDGDNR